MTTITTDQKVVTLVNVFTVDPESQQALVDLLVEATDQVMRRRRDGQRRATSVHRGLGPGR